MAKNLTTFMPGVSIPQKALDGFEVFFGGEQFGGDHDGSRDEAYGKAMARVCLKTTMCDMIAYMHGGGEGGAAFCCCMQGDPGYSGVGNRYSVCCHANSGLARCDEFVLICTGAGGCVCSTPTGHESCLSSMHHCNRVSGESYQCICGAARNGASTTSCFFGYQNSSDFASRGNTCWNSITCSGANCVDLCCLTGCQRKACPTLVGWDCNYCTSCGNAGFNMYKGQCCADGRCGVASMSSGPNVSQPYHVGNHIIKSSWGCEQQHNGVSVTCEFWIDAGAGSNDASHMRTSGRAFAAASGCAGNCECGGYGTPGWGYFRYKDPDQRDNGFGQE